MASAGTTNSQRDNRRVRQRVGNKKNRTERTQEGLERGRRWATTNHLTHYQWDERQIDTGCFKTSAIDNRNRSGVAVARGFRVNLAPHSLPRPSFSLFRSFSLSVSLSLSFFHPAILHPFPLVTFSLASSRLALRLPRSSRTRIASYTHTHICKTLSPPPLAPDHSLSLWFQSRGWPTANILIPKPPRSLWSTPNSNPKLALYISLFLSPSFSWFSSRETRLTTAVAGSVSTV